MWPAAEANRGIVVVVVVSWKITSQEEEEESRRTWRRRDNLGLGGVCLLLLLCRSSIKQGGVRIARTEEGLLEREERAEKL